MGEFGLKPRKNGLYFFKEQIEPRIKAMILPDRGMIYDCSFQRLPPFNGGFIGNQFYSCFYLKKCHPKVARSSKETTIDTIQKF